jgi:predicted dehydrogenase
MKNKIRWGILSTAKIGRLKVIPASYCEITAIASKNLAAAKETAAALNIPKAYGSYEELLADKDIDAIYNPLPNHLHVPWSIKALESGKHVLCEKPIALSSSEAGLLSAAAGKHPHLKVMEAFMYRFHPQWKKAKELARSGAIGKLKTIQSFFSYYNVNSSDIRNQAETGGGGLMDIGCYCISLSRFIFDKEPVRVMGMIERDPVFGTDCLASGMLDFSTGTSTFTCSTQLSPYQRVHIAGTSGRIEIEIPFNAPPDKPCRMWLQTEENIKEIIFEICDQYKLQGDEFSLSILNGRPVHTPLQDAIANMKIIEAIAVSAEKGMWVEPIAL